MKKKAIAAVLMMSMIAGSSLTVCAAPETMADGTVFDAEYYAQTYPDVAAALGTDTNALYQHYVTFGKAEGRLAYNGEEPLPIVTTQTADQPRIIGIQGVVGETYQLPTLVTFEYNIPDKVIVGTIDTAPNEECFNNDLKRLEPVTTEGYEWRFMNYRTTGFYIDDDYDGWYSTYYFTYAVENSKDSQFVEREEDYLYREKFTVTQDGVDYTECKVAHAEGYQDGEASQDGIYFLLPKGYRGKIYFTIQGAKYGEVGTVPDDSNAITFVF